MLIQSNKINREKETVLIMINIFCKNNHNTINELCDECSNLFNYSTTRLNLCLFGIKKPACKKCSVHCYNQEMRQKIINVMKFSGPRMLLSHPLLCLKHLFDSIK
jgi:hypothetical protein